MSRTQQIYIAQEEEDQKQISNNSFQRKRQHIKSSKIAKNAIGYIQERSITRELRMYNKILGNAQGRSEERINRMLHRQQTQFEEEQEEQDKCKICYCNSHVLLNDLCVKCETNVKVQEQFWDNNSDTDSDDAILNCEWKIDRTRNNYLLSRYDEVVGYITPDAIEICLNCKYNKVCCGVNICEECDTIQDESLKETCDFCENFRFVAWDTDDECMCR